MPDVKINKFRSLSKLAILLQFSPIDPHFVRKGCSGASKIAILPQFSPIDPHFVRKGSRFVNPRWRHPRPKERKIKKAREREGREKGERERREERGERVREREDVKMRRSQRRCEDKKVWDKVWEKVPRGADVKMRRCERRCEDPKVWRWEGEDEKVWRWEGPNMRRWEDEIQTPTIGRTLRSDALGKNGMMIPNTNGMMIPTNMEWWSQQKWNDDTKHK